MCVDVVGSTDEEWGLAIGRVVGEPCVSGGRQRRTSEAEIEGYLRAPPALGAQRLSGVASGARALLLVPRLLPAKGAQEGRRPPPSLPLGDSPGPRRAPCRRRWTSRGRGEPRGVRRGSPERSHPCGVGRPSVSGARSASPLFSGSRGSPPPPDLIHPHIFCANQLPRSRPNPPRLCTAPKMPSVGRAALRRARRSPSVPRLALAAAAAGSVALSASSTVRGEPMSLSLSQDVKKSVTEFVDAASNRLGARAAVFPAPSRSHGNSRGVIFRILPSNRAASRIISQERRASPPPRGRRSPRGAPRAAGPSPPPTQSFRTSRSPRSPPVPPPPLADQRSPRRRQDPAALRLDDLGPPPPPAGQPDDPLGRRLAPRLDPERLRGLDHRLRRRARRRPLGIQRPLPAPGAHGRA